MISDFLKKFVPENKNAGITGTFYTIFQKYHKALNEIYRKKGATFEKASKLELALYLLFRYDFILQNSSNPDIRPLFFEASLKKIQDDISGELLNICYLRLEIYGDIYNDVRDKNEGVFSKEFLDFSYDWLISAVELCKDDYKLMAKERYIPLSVSITSNYPIKVCLQELDIKYINEFINNISNIVKNS